ncbi:geranylgeranylglyceryl/heptaprenylglyceryl phosphate synthase, partial [Bacillus pumilus]|uniref:geranylgeranylglyceryl/heptaprenylglyceryl phosphate synthase n=1 Tax=Bacillus pumilus TaxID=1408 RepID=UPI0028CB4341
LNEECKGGKVREGNRGVDMDEVRGYGRVGEDLMKVRIFYVEYRGRVGDIEVVKETKGVVCDRVVFYGGGIEKGKEGEEFGEDGE